MEYHSSGRVRYAATLASRHATAGDLGLQPVCPAPIWSSRSASSRSRRCVHAETSARPHSRSPLLAVLSDEATLWTASAGVRPRRPMWTDCNSASEEPVDLRPADARSGGGLRRGEQDLPIRTPQIDDCRRDSAGLVARVAGVAHLSSPARSSPGKTPSAASCDRAPAVQGSRPYWHRRGRIGVGRAQAVRRGCGRAEQSSRVTLKRCAAVPPHAGPNLLRRHDGP